MHSSTAWYIIQQHQRGTVASVSQSRQVRTENVVGRSTNPKAETDLPSEDLKYSSDIISSTRILILSILSKCRIKTALPTIVQQ
jgi:hypothetical protein